jgi:hypothetical protein
VSQYPAIVVPYANRAEYLRLFLDRVPHYLEEVNGFRDYLIIVAEQLDEGLFSAATARSVGARFAMEQPGVTHVVFNDVDMIPVAKIDYQCRETTICFLNFGGCKVQLGALERVNGYNPLIAGWGYEDTEFYDRLETFDCDAVRWDRSREAEGAVVLDLELRTTNRDDEVAHTRWYWRRDHDSGPEFAACDEAIPRYDRARNWFSPEIRERNIALTNAIYNRYPARRREYYRKTGMNQLQIDQVHAERRERVLHLRFARADVLKGIDAVAGAEA